MALTNLLTKTAAALAQAEIPYLIIGGQAVLLMGKSDSHKMPM